MPRRPPAASEEDVLVALKSYGDRGACDLELFNHPVLRSKTESSIRRARQELIRKKRVTPDGKRWSKYSTERKQTHFSLTEETG